jgi:hypothetical protein
MFPLFACPPLKGADYRTSQRNEPTEGACGTSLRNEPAERASGTERRTGLF